jgi:type IV secretory pathway component VirB8
VSEAKDRIHDYFKGVGSLHFLFSFSFYVNIALVILLLIAIGDIFYLSSKVNSKEPLVVFVDKRSGIAAPVDFNVVDARGIKREHAEFHQFGRAFIENLFTFNEYTSRSNLRKVDNVCSAEVRKTIIRVLKDEDRAALLRPGIQGLVEIDGSIITDQQPDVRLKVEFTRKILGGPEPFTESYLASLRIKTTLRSEANNFSGLYVIEFHLQKVFTSSTE